MNSYRVVWTDAKGQVRSKRVRGASVGAVRLKIFSILAVDPNPIIELIPRRYFQHGVGV